MPISGEFTPEEVAGWFNALPEPEPELQPTLEHVADRLPVQPQAAPPVPTSAWADRPGSGLSALHAALPGVAPAPLPRPAAPKPVTTTHSAPAETLAERNIRELATLIWSEARGVGDQAMTAVGWTIRNRMSRNDAAAVDKAWGGYSHSTMPHGRDLTRTEAIAQDVLNGQKADPTHGATHFYSPSAMPNENIKKEELEKLVKKEKLDVRNGLESVPGVVDENGNAVKSYRPSWTKNFLPEPVDGVADADFKFYKSTDEGPVH